MGTATNVVQRVAILAVIPRSHRGCRRFADGIMAQTDVARQGAARSGTSGSMAPTRGMASLLLSMQTDAVTWGVVAAMPAAAPSPSL